MYPALIWTIREDGIGNKDHVTNKVTVKEALSAGNGTQELRKQRCRIIHVIKIYVTFFNKLFVKILKVRPHKKIRKPNTQYTSTKYTVLSGHATKNGCAIQKYNRRALTQKD